MRFGTWGVLTTAACTPPGSEHTSNDGNGITDTDSGTPDTDDTDVTETDPPACLDDFVIGAGATTFDPLADGDPIQVVYGSQGGWHVDAAGLVTGLGESVSVEAALFDDALGVQLAGLNQKPGFFVLAGYDGCGGTFAGTRTVLDDYLPATGTLFSYICAIGGRELRLEVSVAPLLPTSGTTPAPLVRSVTVIAVGDPAFEADFCGN